MSLPWAGIEPVHQDLGGGTALLYGADLRLRLAMVLLGFRLEKTNSSVAFGEQGFTRALGILGFNLGLGERTEISPYVGLGSAHRAARHSLSRAWAMPGLVSISTTSSRAFFPSGAGSRWICGATATTE